VLPTFFSHLENSLIYQLIFTIIGDALDAHIVQTKTIYTDLHFGMDGVVCYKIQRMMRSCVGCEEIRECDVSLSTTHQYGLLEALE
jgi:hypothetical protein